MTDARHTAPRPRSLLDERRYGVVLFVGALVALWAAGPAGTLQAGDWHVALFVLAIAAAEAAVGLALVIALYRLKGSTDTDLARLLRW